MTWSVFPSHHPTNFLAFYPPSSQSQPSISENPLHFACHGKKVGVFSILIHLQRYYTVVGENGIGGGKNRVRKKRKKKVRMRYTNWDVLLFPEGSKVPLQEFKTGCYVTEDPGTFSIGGERSAFSLPTSTQTSLTPLQTPWEEGCFGLRCAHRLVS